MNISDLPLDALRLEIAFELKGHRDAQYSEDDVLAINYRFVEALLRHAETMQRQLRGISNAWQPWSRARNYELTWDRTIQIADILQAFNKANPPGEENS